MQGTGYYYHHMTMPTGIAPFDLAYSLLIGMGSLAPARGGGAALEV